MFNFVKVENSDWLNDQEKKDIKKVREDLQSRRLRQRHRRKFRLFGKIEEDDLSKDEDFVPSQRTAKNESKTKEFDDFTSESDSLSEDNLEQVFTILKYKMTFTYSSNTNNHQK